MVSNEKHFLVHSKTHMVDRFEQLHQICSTNDLEISPEKSFKILLTVKFLVHESGNNNNKPVSSKVADILRLKTPPSKLY